MTLRILKQVMEEKLDHHNVQLAQVLPLPSIPRSRLPLTQVTKETGFEILGEQKLQEVIEQM